MGLNDQPCIVIFNEKLGRRHCYVIWLRIDAAEMKVIKLPFFNYRIMDISRELYHEHGWNMPCGMIDRLERDPNSYTLAQWQQAKRIGKKPKDIKSLFKDCWSVSDSQTSFQAALQEH